MKKKIILSFALLLLACSQNNVHHPSEGNQQERKLPSFELMLMDSSTKITTDKIPEGKPIVMIFLNPNCPFCKAETQAIVSHYDILKNIQFLFISSYPYNQIKKYYNQFHLSKYPNIIVGDDYTAYFLNYYRPSSVPYVVVYNKQKQFQEAVNGRITIDQLKEIMD